MSCCVSLCVCVCVCVCSCLSFLCRAPVTHSDFTCGGSAYLAVIPSICHHVSFPLTRCLISLPPFMLLSFYPCSYNMQPIRVSTCLMLLSLDVFLPASLHKMTLDVASARVYRVVVQNQQASSDLTRW